MTGSEAVVREFLAMCEKGDLDGALALLDPEVEWRNTGLPTLRGSAARRALTEMGRRGMRFEARMHHVAESGDVVLTDRTDVLRWGRWESSFRVRGTFRVRGGRIVLWDDGFSWGSFLGSSLIGLLRVVRR